MLESFEILMVFSSLWDLGERESVEDRQLTTYHSDNLGNKVLGLAVPFDAIVEPGPADCISDTALQIFR